MTMTDFYGCIAQKQNRKSLNYMDLSKLSRPFENFRKVQVLMVHGFRTDFPDLLSF